jgi:regulator of RNase E activity RraA
MEKDTVEYFDTIERALYTSVLADIMDDLGHRDRAMRHDIRPVYAGAKVAGRAATMLFTEVYEVPAEPYALELALLDSLVPGEVVVGSTQGSMRAAVWGELISTHARARGGRGAVLDGPTRDAWGIEEQRFPVFATGFTPLDSKGRLDVIAMRCPVEVGGVLVRDGDLVLGDVDGCVVVPQELEDEVVRRGLEKVSGENEVREVLARGTSIAQVFRDYGIL